MSAPVATFPRTAFMNILCGALFYFLAVFAAGVLFGTFRILILVPRLGATSAVLVELPFMLAVSWVMCGWTVRKWSVDASFRSRLALGLWAFLFLMFSELMLAVAVFGRTPARFLADLCSAAGVLGLAGQVAFAIMPLMRSVDWNTLKR